uniref:Uncharacterized protein n=1 Tax=Amphimedon queenslandica TaxID=400682 RepID=A0A1X7TWB8_AMPQE
VNENGDSTYTTFSKTETTFVIESNKEQSDDVSMSYTTIAEVNAATHGDSEVITKSLNANEKQQQFPNTTTTTAGTTTNSIRSKALPPQTKASSAVQYTDTVDKIISNPTESESDNEVVVSASLAIAIRATGRNT